MDVDTHKDVDAYRCRLNRYRHIQTHVSSRHTLPYTQKHMLLYISDQQKRLSHHQCDTQTYVSSRCTLPIKKRDQDITTHTTHTHTPISRRQHTQTGTHTYHHPHHPHTHTHFSSPTYTHRHTHVCRHFMLTTLQ